MQFVPLTQHLWASLKKKFRLKGFPCQCATYEESGEANTEEGRDFEDRDHEGPLQRRGKVQLNTWLELSRHVSPQAPAFAQGWQPRSRAASMADAQRLVQTARGQQRESPLVKLHSKGFMCYQCFRDAGQVVLAVDYMVLGRWS